MRGDREPAGGEESSWLFTLKRNASNLPFWQHRFRKPCPATADAIPERS